MKQRVAVTIAAVVVLTAMTAAAQPMYFSSLEAHRKADLGKITCQYTACLKTKNVGVIESALGHVVRMKMYLPEVDCPELRQEISSLSVTGPSASVRYKAYLAGLVFDSPGLFKEEAVRDYEGPEDLFRSVGSRLQITLLGSANTKFVRPE
jgi:hypothetical protein